MSITHFQVCSKTRKRKALSKDEMRNSCLEFLILAGIVDFSGCEAFVYCFTSQFVLNRMYVKSWYAYSFGTYLHITLFQDLKRMVS